MKVIILDDCEADRWLLERFASQAKEIVEVFCFASSSQLFRFTMDQEVFKTNTLLICDYRAPLDTTGLDVIKAIHKSYAGYPIYPVLMSGSVVPEIKERDAEVVKDFFMKPFGLDEYESILTQMVKNASVFFNSNRFEKIS